MKNKINLSIAEIKPLNLRSRDKQGSRATAVNLNGAILAHPKALFYSQKFFEGEQIFCCSFRKKVFI